jgi:hypothetical protein
MFHAGAVLPSSTFLLQLLTPPGGDFGRPLDVYDVSEPPVRAALRVRSAGGRARGLKVLEPLVLLAVLGPLLREKPGDGNAGLGMPPVAVGLNAPAPPRLGPMVVGKLDGLFALATRLKALRHCST